MRFVELHIIRSLATRSVVVAALALAVSGAALADNDCTLGVLKLRGTYVFTASGYNIASGVAQPKSIVELILFNGDGTLSVPAATVSLNGTIVKSPPGGAGSTYTVDASCTGTITFSSGQTYDMFVSSRGEHIWMIQTNPNTVFQGVATAATAK